jgi:hypothetical protein
MQFDNVWRLSTAQALAVASVGGAAASSSAFGTQTYAIQLSYPGSTSSTGGCRIAIVSPNDNAVSSTAGTLLPANWIDVFRCSPGQRVSAISNDAGTFSLNHRADRLMPDIQANQPRRRASSVAELEVIL